MGGSVPLMTDLDGVSAEAPLALVRPAVDGIAQVGQEGADGQLIGADGRAGASLGGSQVGRPPLEMSG